jgi:hypothetical protein
MTARAMSSAAKAIVAVHEPAKKMFTVTVDGLVSKLTYEKAPGIIDLQHTLVGPTFVKWGVREVGVCQFGPAACTTSLHAMLSRVSPACC